MFYCVLFADCDLIVDWCVYFICSFIMSYTLAARGIFIRLFNKFHIKPTVVSDLVRLNRTSIRIFMVPNVSGGIIVITQA